MITIGNKWLTTKISVTPTPIIFNGGHKKLLVRLDRRSSSQHKDNQIGYYFLNTGISL